MKTVLENIKVFPNPASDFIGISGVNKEIKIFEMMGREDWKGIVNDGMRVDVSCLSTGIYFLVSSEKSQSANFLILK